MQLTMLRIAADRPKTLGGRVRCSSVRCPAAGQNHIRLHLVSSRGGWARDGVSEPKFALLLRLREHALLV